ncbi:MAG: Gfo/Idh/MocA family oxidoreductase [Sulfurospirillum sp.]|nr:Gfo/Idh/MocA family oxidoreductase [Sulfurospirillum sp.]MBL0702657.1 Gfo/Idh/MocA family oxidoreductase [Sulfurospirillum sp.]
MKNSKNFALLGASGYIAPRHMRAIKETKNNLVAALDPYDGIGIMDNNFPKASFFTEFERFDRFVDKWHREQEKKIEYISISTPNYLHDSHIRFALKSGCDAICEKPLVLNPHNLDQLKVIENETGKKVHAILQLRLHPSIIALKKKVSKELKLNSNKIYDINLAYLTSRGKWYFESWKGNKNKSGGIASNIGIHFFDMLLWIFGELEENIININLPDVNSGILKLKNANIKWFLSINYDYLPQHVKTQKKTTFRNITVDEDQIEFSSGFEDLHTRSYEEILKGNGFSLDDAYSSIDIVSQIRDIQPKELKGEYHSYCKKVII